MSKVWVELSASGSAAHGPALRIRLVSPQHPQVRGQVQNSKAADSSNAGSASRTQLHLIERLSATAGERHGQIVNKHGADVLAKQKEEAVGRRDKYRPEAGRHQHRHNIPAEPSNIAAVLASSRLCDVGGAVLSQEAALAHVSADIQQDLAGVQQPGCKQLISHTILPGVVHSEGVDGKPVHALWNAQVRLGKLAAKLNATFTMSERRHRLQEKVQLASFRVAELQKGLLC